MIEVIRIAVHDSTMPRGNRLGQRQIGARQPVIRTAGLSVGVGMGWQG